MLPAAGGAGPGKPFPEPVQTRATKTAVGRIDRTLERGSYGLTVAAKAGKAWRSITRAWRKLQIRPWPTAGPAAKKNDAGSQPPGIGETSS
jgi:hypothetical protein